MDRDPPKSKAEASKAVPSRDDRRKAALKANMARRKAQARGRAADAATDGHGEDPSQSNHKTE